MAHIGSLPELPDQAKETSSSGQLSVEVLSWPEEAPISRLQTPNAVSHRHITELDFV